MCKDCGDDEMQHGSSSEWHFPPQGALFDVGILSTTMFVKNEKDPDGEDEEVPVQFVGVCFPSKAGNQKVAVDPEEAIAIARALVRSAVKITGKTYDDLVSPSKAKKVFQN